MLFLRGSISHIRVTTSLLFLNTQQTTKRSFTFFRRTAKHRFTPQPSISEDSEIKDRPFSLPPGEFKPKQSLGQNYLSDQNTVVRICNKFSDDSDQGCRVIEIGPGAGALTRVLFPRYPKMTAIEVDHRAVKFLATRLPNLKVIHLDVLLADWRELAAERGGRLNVIGNLPYNIVSQVLFTMADAPTAINKAVVTMQLELADRIVAPPRSKRYGIPSVVFQLYAMPEKLIHIPPTVFFPQPDVNSALISLDFTRPHPLLRTVDKTKLKLILSTAFQQRRKMLRQSLKLLLAKEGLELSVKWAEKRPEELKPVQFLELVLDLYGPIAVNTDEGKVWRVDKPARSDTITTDLDATTAGLDAEDIHDLGLGVDDK